MKANDPDAALANLAAMLAKIDWHSPDSANQRAILGALSVHLRHKLAQIPKPSADILRMAPLIEAFIHWTGNPNDERLANDLQCAFQFYADGL